MSFDTLPTRTSWIRHGRVPIVMIFAISSVVAVILLTGLALMMRPDARRESTNQATLKIYCAAGVAKPVEDIVDKFNAEFDANIEIVRTGGSGELAGILKTEFVSQVSDGADLYITADDLLLDQAKSEGIIAEQFSLAVQKPVIAVRYDSPIQFASLSDLVNQTEHAFGIASERAAVGKLVRQIAERDQVLDALLKNRKTDSENVMILAQALVAKSLGAAVIWDTTVNQLNQQYQEPVLRIAAPVDSLSQHQSNIAVGVVSTTEHPTLAIQFARYLTSAEKGNEIFVSYGFEAIAGDRWEEVPEIHLYCGSMFTPVLEERVRQFSRREGINLYSRWEGCGALSSSIQKITNPELFPDAYLACDRQFLDRVSTYFEPPITISTNDIVMVVRKDVSARIEMPQDVVNEQLRVGICDPEISALGWLTKEMFSKPPFDGLYQRISDHAIVTVDVGPTLISQLASGGLDVAFVYRTNILSDPNVAAKMKIIDIDDQGARTARAVQPWAISRTTQNPNLMQRLLDVIVSQDTGTRFEGAGFSLPPSQADD